MEYYNKNIKDDLKHLQDMAYFREWLSIVEEILLNDEFQKRKLFRHHDSNLWKHLVDVSYRSFVTAKYYNYDERVCAIAGLLHDFYPKAYKYSKELEELDPEYLTDVKKKQPILQMHGFTHAKAAANNALKYFPHLIDEKTYSCIETHMFPVNKRPPKYIEGWIITFMDKRMSLEVIKEIRYIPGIVKNKLFHLK